MTSKPTQESSKPRPADASPFRVAPCTTAAIMERARIAVASSINASPEEIYFTSGATESDNIAILGTALCPSNARKHIITTSIEHPAVREPCKHLESLGFRVTYLPVSSSGTISQEDISRSITPDTFLISVMHVNNETGSIEPIEKAASLAGKNGILFHTDSVQSYLKLKIDVKRMNIDLLSGSAHKLYGPKGAGFLYIRQGSPVTPLTRGGHQENNLRPGTLNVPGIAGLGKAVELGMAEFDERNAHIKALGDFFLDGIMNGIEGAVLNGEREKKVPGTINASFPGIEGESLLLALDVEGIAVSTGSACASGSQEPSGVLTAMGLDALRQRGALRFSLGKDNTRQELELALDHLRKIVKRLRRISPLR